MYRKHKPKPVILQGEIDTNSPESLFKDFDNKIKLLFNFFNLKTLMNKAGITKSKGYAPADLLYLLVLQPFFKKKLTAFWTHDDFKKTIQAQKDAFYRFVGKPRNNWRKFIYQLFFGIQRCLNPVPYKDRFLVVDTTLVQKTGTSIEFISRMFDHVSKSHILCFPSTFLGYFDGKSFFPLDVAISATSNRPQKDEKQVDKRSCGYKRRQEAKDKTTNNLVSMLKRAYDKGVEARYVLFDSWFSYDSLLHKIVDIGYHVICRAKVGNVKYHYNGHDYTAKRLFSKVVRKQMKKLDDLGFYAGRVEVSLPSTGRVALVFCQYTRKSKFSLFLSTDLQLDTAEIVGKYAKRWSIEMFFRDAKQYLSLGKEQNRDFDAVIAHQSFVIIRYLLLSFMIRRSSQREPIGPLFEDVSDKIAQATILTRLWDFFKKLLIMSSELLLGEHEKNIINQLIDYMENIVPNPIKTLLLEGAKV